MNNDVVIIHLDRERKMKFAHTALMTLEELTGLKIAELDQQMDLMDHDLRAKVVYCGLLKDAKDNGETLSLENMPDLLDEAPNIVHVIEQVTRAWQAAFPAPKDNASGNQQPPVDRPEKSKNTTGKKAAG